MADNNKIAKEKMTFSIGIDKNNEVNQIVSTNNLSMMSISLATENGEQEDFSKIEPRYWKTWDQMSRTELIDSLFRPMT